MSVFFSFSSNLLNSATLFGLRLKMILQKRVLGRVIEMMNVGQLSSFAKWEISFLWKSYFSFLSFLETKMLRGSECVKYTKIL